MQQQHIQQRNVSFALLGRAEVLCNTWKRVYSKTLQLLQSIDNNLAQKLAASEATSVLKMHEIDRSRLLFEQTATTENLIQSLRSTIDLLQEVCDDWRQLETDATRHMSKSLALHIPSKPAPLSTSSLIDVTAVSPTEVHDMIATLAYQHFEEYNSKKVLLAELSYYLSHVEIFRNMVDVFSSTTCIDSTIEKELKERLQLYKTVKKVLESVD